MLVSRGLAGAILLCFVSIALTQVPSAKDNEFGCDCMEYWKCVMSGGSVFSYCGLSDSSVCCFLSPGGSGGSVFTGGGASLDRPAPPGSGRGCGRKGGAAPESDGVAEFGEWRWHAAVLEKPDDLYVCGASLLHDKWVVTAAHCVDDYAHRGNVSSTLKIRLGEHDVTRSDEGDVPHQEVDVLTVIIHPQFDNRSLSHDIALLKLKSPAKRRSNVGVVCVPRPNEFGVGFDWIPDQGTLDSRCYITGWGRRSETSDHSVVLKEVRVPLWSHDTCEVALKDQFGSTYVLPNSSICAGALGRDACDGDGGGPLSCERDGVWWQVGIVSFGIGCGRRNTPGVYTRVDRYYNWILETIHSEKKLLTSI